MPFHALQKGRLKNWLFLSVMLTACAIGLSSCGGVTSQPSEEVVLKSLAISPASPVVVIGGGQQFTVTGTYSNGKQRDLSQKVTWNSGQPTVATVDSTGKAVSKQAGTAMIIAVLGSVSGSATLTVSTPTLVSLAVTPSSPKIPKGESQQFRAIGTFSDNSTQDVTSTAVWNASANEDVKVNGAVKISGKGLAVGQTVGTVVITAELNSITGTTTLTVTPPVLTSIAITPSPSSVGLNTNEQLSVTGTFSDNSTQDLTTTASWASSKTSVATIHASGLAVTLSIGKTTITATSGSLSASAALNVLPIAAVDYFSNANNAAAPDGTLNLINTGLTGDNLCAMIYVFDSSQEMNECCGCSISEHGIRTLSVNNDLTANTLTRVTLTTGIIRVIPADAASNPTCNAGNVTPSGVVLPWMTHIQDTGAGTFGITETEPAMHPLNSSDLSGLASDCAFLQKLGSGHGVCTCGVGD